jgi:hypothetical protein
VSPAEFATSVSSSRTHCALAIATNRFSIERTAAGFEAVFAEAIE